MRKLRVRDLDEWPPQTAVAFAPGKMPRVSQEEAIVRVFIRREGRSVRFGSLLGGASYAYTYEVKTENLAEQLETIVKNSTGKSLSSLGELEIEDK
jgi:hypothetical protein